MIPKSRASAIPPKSSATGRISGPLLDRIDIHIQVPVEPFQELAAGTSSAAMREHG